ncbi:hypothetical protein M885DRAFT_499517 [Pelagophyceae sp. CCMP2097]|nr:hypothetical protein M885DRAFT_499517 [Pelagophyceae sp. CCMP2097]
MDDGSGASGDDDHDLQQEEEAAAALEEEQELAASFELEVMQRKQKPKKKLKAQPETWLNIRPGLQRNRAGAFEFAGGSSSQIKKLQLPDKYAEEATLGQIAQEGKLDLTRAASVRKYPAHVLNPDPSTVVRLTLFNKQKIYVVSHGKCAAAGTVVLGLAPSHDRSSSKSQAADLGVEGRSPASRRGAALLQSDVPADEDRPRPQHMGSAAAPFNVEDDEEDLEDRNTHVHVAVAAWQHVAPAKPSRQDATAARRAAPPIFGVLYGLGAELQKLNRVLQSECGGVLDSQQAVHAAGLVKAGRAPPQLLPFLKMVDGRLIVS